MTKSTKAPSKRKGRPKSKKANPRNKKHQDSKFYFDKEAADHAQGFIENLCTLTKGGASGKPFELSKWQREEVVRPAFGWKRRSDGYRKFREVYVEIPKKNAKTHLGAAIALYLLFGDDEKGAEIICGAGDREQARIAYDIAFNMVENNSDLKAVAEVMQRAIYYKNKNSSFKAVSHESGTKHGYDISGLLIDELHAHKDRSLYDVLHKGTASRPQPITFIMTTAGVADLSTIGYQMHEYACKVRDGIIHDEGFLPVIYGADEDDDPFSKKTWKKANPNFGVSVDEEYFKREANKAKIDSAELEVFKRLHLNIWTNSQRAYFEKEDWEACDLGEVTEENMEGKKCYVGVDLSKTTDFTSIVCVFPDEDGCHVLPYFIIPEESIERRVLKGQIWGWKEGGYIRVHDGNVVDYRDIYGLIHRLNEKFDVQEIAYDPYGANRVFPELIEEGFECVQMRQGWKTMSPAMKETKNQILQGKLNHGGNPVLSWMNSNLMVKEDEAGNVQPHKGKSRDAIDGMVAMFMALDRSINAERQDEPFKKGIRSL
jgi:phage terminase large subunit-like protein